MNQIPNIEETNTREVEEKIIEEFQDKDHIITSDGKLYVEIDAHWLHHQLQKVQEEERERYRKYLKHHYENYGMDSVKELINVPSDHSELDQDIEALTPKE